MRPNEMVIEKLLLSLVMLKTQLVASKLVTANKHFPSSASLIGVLNEKISSCVFTL